MSSNSALLEMRVFESRFRAGFLPLRHVSRVFNLSPQMAARKYGIAHDVELTEIMVPFITCETAFHRNVGELFFCYQRISFVFVDPSSFCQITYRAQLRGFGSRVSSSDVCR